MDAWSKFQVLLLLIKNVKYLDHEQNLKATSLLEIDLKGTFIIIKSFSLTINSWVTKYFLTQQRQTPLLLSCQCNHPFDKAKQFKVLTAKE